LGHFAILIRGAHQGSIHWGDPSPKSLVGTENQNFSLFGVDLIQKQTYIINMVMFSCPFGFTRQFFGVSAMDRFQNIVFQLAQVLGIIVEVPESEDGLL